MKAPKTLSRRIQKAAQNKHIGTTPQVKLLIEAIGDTIEDDNNTYLTDHNIDLNDINFLSTIDDTTIDEFHDASTSLNNQSTE